MIGQFLLLLDTQTEKDKFTDLYNTYKNLLYYLAFEKTHNKEDSEECVQETFFYVAKHFEKVGEVHSKMTKCYLSTIVTGFAIDVYNNSKRTDEFSYNHNVSSDYFENFNKLELLSVFDEVLDDASKVFLYLKYIYGYKSSEIAEIYNVKDTYVRKKIQYAKEKIRKYYEEGGKI